MVCLNSHKVSVPRGTQGLTRNLNAFTYGAVTRSGPTFQLCSISILHLRWNSADPPVSPITPMSQRPQSIPQHKFRLLPFRSPLLGESFLFLRVLRCFSSPRALHQTYVFSLGCRISHPAGFPIRKPPTLRPHTARRGFSQCTASFVGTQRLGILLAPLLASPSCYGEIEVRVPISTMRC